MKSVSVEVKVLGGCNLALQQNALPVIEWIEVKNDGNERLDGLRCSIRCTPGFIEEKTIELPALNLGEVYRLNRVDVVLRYDVLLGLSEAVNGTLSFDFVCNGVDGRPENLCGVRRPLTAYAYDQWLGTEVFPELICSFVTPNLDLVCQLQSKVAQELEAATGSAAICGYQQGRERAYEICKAAYRALASWKLQYAEPLASFDSVGQRIRLADKIYMFHLATCLDSTLLYASLLEQCGLNPVIIIQKSHAYIGCHLLDDHFPELPLRDLQQIRKLSNMDDFTVVETTMLTDSSATFSDAERHARERHLDRQDDFVLAIDVKRARSSGIRPLPLVRNGEGIAIDPVQVKREDIGKESTRKLSELVSLEELEDKSNIPPRVRRWTQRLLDLSLRNPLLNSRDTRQVIPLLCTNIAGLENHIADNKRISVQAVEKLVGDRDTLRVMESGSSGLSAELREVIEKELSSCRLWSPLTDKELQGRLKFLYRTGRVDLEEGGVNTIFLAVGMVEWRERQSDSRGYLAPVLLVPIRIERASIADGYKIIRLDEETLVNETLLEMLRSQFHLEIPGVHPLPTDDSGVDVEKVMQIFRTSLKELKGWEVREEVRIGHFSFGKFVMWTDMTSRLEALQNNSLVSHLISGGGLYSDDIEVFPPSELSSHLDLNRLFCPMSADSSQLTAVLYSELGKTFVLHGPPGTGKSQTITNIIAHNLALGRRVLFVSEKKAALDVVHHRLSKIGLRPFCLELHSSKAGKGAVLAQFAEALRVPEQSAGRKWSDVAQDLTTLRTHLNEYVDALHHVYPCGLSVYDCFSVFLIDSSPLPPKILGLDGRNISTEQLKAAHDAVSVLASRWQMTTPEAVEALQPLTVQAWNPLLEKGIRAQAADLSKALDGQAECVQALAELLNWEGTSSRKGLTEFLQLQPLLSSVPPLPAKLLTAEFIAEKAFVEEFLSIAASIVSLEKKLQDYDFAVVAKTNWAGVEQRLTAAKESFFIVRFFKVRSLVKEVSSVKRPGGIALTEPELSEKLAQFKKYADLSSKYQGMLKQAETLLGAAWMGKERLEQTRQLVDAAQLIMKICAYSRCLDNLCDIFGKPVEYRADTVAAFDKLSKATDGVEKSLAAMLPNASGLDGMDYLPQIKAFAKYIESPDADIRGVLQFRMAEQVACELGCGVMCDIQREKLCEPTDLETCFDRMFRMELIDAVIAESPSLSQFTGLERGEKIRRFRNLDDQFLTLSQQIVVARLADRLPRKRKEKGPENSELGRLQRECEKKSRQKPVRQLLDQIQSLLPVLKPCFLMSPMSVAQYLPADTAPFDLVVFDEASQIPVWDAIGVIARGKQLIVVGDPKQMPPTNFFQKGDAKSEDVDDANEEDIPDDMESILDECLAAGVHSSYLNWHYRSRHESLIAFSNHYYYDDKLYTFPAAVRPPTNGVRFEYIPNGVYAFGGARTNRVEAEALVDYVVRRLHETGGRRSVGIVTFSEAQRDLIEDLLDARREKDPSIEPAFADTNPEPLFVKNLENVQGDERDVILFSICYAKDANGKLSLNFGPLNRQGGERRLNVAVTRAKEQIVVFSSIHGSEINLDHAKSTGAAHLRQFLDFAEKGIAVQGRQSSGGSDGLGTAIERFLVENGYEIVRNVGCSGCRIDVAVRHPKKPDEFILGIECDGPGYASMQTVRDRDHLIDSVLERLGWHLWRAWTMDWVYDAPHAKAALLTELERLVNLPEETTEPAGVNVQTTEEKKAEDEQPVEEVPKNLDSNQQKKAYKVWKPSRPLKNEQWMNDKVLASAIKELLEIESPVCESVFRKRILSAFGVPRMTDAVSQRLMMFMPSQCLRVQMLDDFVLWAPGQSPETFKSYRPSSSDGSDKRAIDEIPSLELKNAMQELQLDYGIHDQETLFKETIRVFGLSVLTAKARKYLEYAYGQ